MATILNVQRALQGVFGLIITTQLFQVPAQLAETDGNQIVVFQDFGQGDSLGLVVQRLLVVPPLAFNLGERL